MKTVLVAVNASYVHINPAVRSLATASNGRASFAEYNINQDPHDILRELLAYKADAIGFSCYIWNIEFVLRLAMDVKLAVPNTCVFLGGPEATFRAEELLHKLSVDYVMCGEGEERIEEFLAELENGSRVKTKGVLFLEDKALAGNEAYQTADVEKLPAPFSAGDLYDENRIYYYESSRGCAFACAYCLSGAVGGVREKSLEKVKSDIRAFLQRGVKLVKFTDRTFNHNAERAREIIRFLLEEAGDTAFHFEVALDLMDDEMIALLQSAPRGKIQLEAGVQTTNERTLTAVIRKTDVKKIAKNAVKIMEARNIHLHLDLIAGLPYENLESFRRSFDEIYGIYPDALQLGFLKLLPGTRLRKEAERRGIVYRSYAPYEVIRTDDMSAEEILYLKGIEQLLNRYYNTGRARTAFDYLTQEGIFRPFELYERLYAFCEENGYASRPVGARNQFVLLIEFANAVLKPSQKDAFFRALRQDYDHTKVKGKIPEEIAEK